MAAQGGEGERAVAAKSREAVARAGRRAGKPHREIAVGLCGRERMGADRHAAGRLRAKLRRMLQRARAKSGTSPDGAGPGTA